MKLEKIRTMEEFAAVSGISRPTLSKYFNDPGSVRSSTRERIEAALDRYDYRPNIYAVNQNRQMTRNIGIVVPYLADPFFAEVARNLEPLCAEAGFRPILLSSHGDPAQEIENLESLRAIKPAGVLLAPLGRESCGAVGVHQFEDARRADAVLQQECHEGGARGHGEPPPVLARPHVIAGELVFDALVEDVCIGGLCRAVGRDGLVNCRVRHFGA